MIGIKIKNFGPIKEGYLDNDGYMSIPNVSVFIGDQGSGKSTIAKVISTCSWIEKAVLRDGVNKDSDILDFAKQLQYQNIHNYLRDDSEIHYKNEKIGFYLDLQDRHLDIGHSVVENYISPKIMYVPAERNFLSVIENAEKIEGLPKTLLTFLDEYKKSLKALPGIINLPIGNAKLNYLPATDTVFISGNRSDYYLHLSEASSGLQSAIPLLLVSNYLSELVNENKNNSGRGDASLKLQKELDKEVELIGKMNIPNTVRESMLRNLSSRFFYSRFLNIVEEMEQNLYPESQRSILQELLRCVNRTDGNSLILTTHSPYVINYLSLAIKADSLKKKIGCNVLLTSKLEGIVPLNSTISGDQVAIYELSTNGTISKLETWEGLPSDENYLNSFLAETNDLYDELLEIENELD